MHTTGKWIVCQRQGGTSLEVPYDVIPVRIANVTSEEGYKIFADEMEVISDNYIAFPWNENNDAYLTERGVILNALPFAEY